MTVVHPLRPRAVDTIGASLFHHGTLGAAHVRAHRALDEGRIREGRASLGAFLAHRSGHGSEWAHVQWHQLVFELELGAIDHALQRFRDHVAPAVRAGVAETDGPSALWRIALRAPAVRLDWRDVHAVALRGLSRGSDRPFVVLHHLLAAAGAEDLGALRRVAAGPDQALACCARALAAWVHHDMDRVVYELDALSPADRAHIGGSHAQNGLLMAIRDRAEQLADQSVAA